MSMQHVRYMLLFFSAGVIPNLFLISRSYMLLTQAAVSYALLIILIWGAAAVQKLVTFKTSFQLLLLECYWKR